MIGILGGLGVLLILFSASTYSGIASLTFLVAFILGIGQSSLFPLTNAILADTAPEQLRGRVLGLLSLDRGMTALGGAFAGFLAAAVGAQVAQIVFGLGCILLAIMLFIGYPALRRID